MNLTSKGNRGFSRYEQKSSDNIQEEINRNLYNTNLNDLNNLKQKSHESYLYKVSIDLASKVSYNQESNSASTSDSMIKKFTFNKNIGSLSTPECMKNAPISPLTDKINSNKNSINSAFDLSNKHS